MKAEALREHEWLHQLVGEWSSEMEVPGEPGKEAMVLHGTETVRSLGGLWVVAEGRGEMPGGGEATSLMTLGYDPAAGRFVGTFVASVMTHLWLYAGELDEARRVLTLATEGPDMSNGGGTTSYRDAIEMVGANERLLSSEMLRQDGSWLRFMTARYRRRPASAGR